MPLLHRYFVLCFQISPSYSKGGTQYFINFDFFRLQYPTPTKFLYIQRPTRGSPLHPSLSLSSSSSSSPLRDHSVYLRFKAMATRAFLLTSLLLSCLLQICSGAYFSSLQRTLIVTASPKAGEGTTITSLLFLLSLSQPSVSSHQTEICKKFQKIFSSCWWVEFTRSCRK